MITNFILKIVKKIGNTGIKLLDVEDKKEITFADYLTRYIPGILCLITLYFIEAIVFPFVYIIKKIKGEDTSSFWEDNKKEKENK